MVNRPVEPGYKHGGWVLVSADLPRGHSRNASLLVQRCTTSGDDEEAPLHVPVDGRIRTLVRLPADVVSLSFNFADGYGNAAIPAPDIRRIGIVERCWRMVFRVALDWARLSPDERMTTGLTVKRAMVDLSGAYGIAIGLRVPMSYSEWIRRFETLSDEDRRLIRSHVARLPAKLAVHVVVLADGDAVPAGVLASLASLHDQLYRNFSATVLDANGALGTAFDAGPGTRLVAGSAVEDWLVEFNTLLGAQGAGAWVMLLHAGDRLPEHALYCFALAAQDNPDAVLLYADEDSLDAEGNRCEPQFKPDWSLAHLREMRYIGDVAMLRGDAVAAAGGVTVDCCRYGDYDLMLRVVDAAGEYVTHVPAVLMHRWRVPDSDDAVWGLDAVRRHLVRRGVAADVTVTRDQCRRVRYKLGDFPPLVSIIVPTRDAVTLLRQCIDSLRLNTTYSRFEILVIDNGSADAQALAYLAQVAGYANARVLRYDYPFNFSAINNFAMREARGEVLCLLNNDTEVISPDWLDEMVGQLLQPRVGAVGAKLLYSDGRVQHAGDAVGIGGCANHLHAHIRRDDPGYCSRAVVAQDLSAVTAACMVTWRDLYRELGGLDEKDLAVAFNDVDYCLRLRAAGHRVVWTPHAELYHHESVSRGKANSWRRKLQARHEVMVMRRRWAREMQQDPFYNPNLSYQQADFSLSHAPRVRKPWR